MRQKGSGTSMLEGEVSPPGDKSISHRAVILNAIAAGNARVTNFSPGADCTSTVQCLRTLGIEINETPDDKSTLNVKGSKGRFKEPETVLNILLRFMKLPCLKLLWTNPLLVVDEFRPSS